MEIDLFEERFKGVRYGGKSTFKVPRVGVARDKIS